MDHVYHKLICRKSVSSERNRISYVHVLALHCKKEMWSLPSPRRSVYPFGEMDADAGYSEAARDTAIKQAINFAGNGPRD